MDEHKQTAILRWLIKSGNDLKTAQTMLTTDPPITDTVCFHAQQCAEKSLKAFLTSVDVHVEKTHFLPRLIELCRNIDSGFDDLKEPAIALTDYAVEVRYPDDWRDIPLDEAVKAVKNAEKIMMYVQQKLS
ncbi:MAG: HEPN domain-containing protein [Nitrospirae bacterium]|nr:HEPN domain-containing protein [Nitrospirota bacterium]MBI3598206.1 HEPN domain-containing protein [Candidatus Troglogloeales bacterium]